MMELKNNSHFEPFSCLAPLPSITYITSKDFVDFTSRKSTYNSLLEAIKNGKNKMIGLYGMGGSGKTTLAKEVGKKVDEMKLFDKVIMVVVSKPPNIEKIQKEIADQIDLKFHEETQSGRAQRLSATLKKKKILIILDDVWEYISIEDIGIPLVEGCHILLTTRLQSVCSFIDCEPMIELPLITKEEAWELFKKHANVCNDPSNMFEDVGSKIVDECKELPIAIVVVGRSLKGKPIGVWESTLWRLKRPQPLNNVGHMSSAYACLELSYDSLPSSTAKSLFLLCSMFPEDHEIPKEDLIRFGKSIVELEETIVTMEDTRREILDALQILLDSCLLINTNNQACVKMHDLVRDVALWISKKQHQAILVDGHVVSRMLAENKSLKETKVISLWNLEDNFMLSNQLLCPTLEILLLHLPYREFVEDLRGIKSLKVLALIRSSFKWVSWWGQIQWSMPQSSPLNLQTICLRGIALGDISFLCQLKGLEILDLHGSKFNELPAGIVDMKKLKLLDLFDSEIEKNPVEVIERCEQLEELYFSYAILENFSLSGLKRYVIYDSTAAFHPFIEYFDACMEELRALAIRGLKVSALNSSMKDLILRANHLWLANCVWDHEDINVEIKHLGVSKCRKKRFIIDKHDVETKQVFSYLITLRLLDMASLEQVFQDSSISCSLPMLQELCIDSCPELRTCIFTDLSSQVVHGDHCLPLPKLEKLTLRNLPKLRDINIFEGGSECSQPQHNNGNERERVLNLELCSLQLYNLKELEYIWNKSSTKSVISLHKLKIVSLEKCSKLRNIFTLAIVTNLPELWTLTVKECEECEGIFCEEALKSLSSSSNVCFPKLRGICIEDCKRVRRVLSYSKASQHYPSLKRIRISDCSLLERLVDNEEAAAAHGNHRRPLLNLEELYLKSLPKLRDINIFGGGLECPTAQHKDGNERIKVMNSELCYLYLEELAELKYIWSENPTQSVISLHRLKNVQLRGCPKLKSIFTPAIVTRLLELRKLMVSKCEEWLGIFCEESLKNLFFSSSSSSSCNVCFPKLEEIYISSCKRVRRVLSYSMASQHCPSLERLDVWGCEELERLVDEEEAADGDHHLLLPKLKEIRIVSCKRVRRVLSYSMASQHCPSLVRLGIWNCEELERLVDDEEEAAAAHGDYRLPLPNLKKLYLVCLPKLRDINIFGGGLECPQPQHKDGNERIKMMNSELCSLYLQDLGELEYIWNKDITQSVISLHRLKNVRLEKCSKLKSIFTLAIITSLPELMTLEVKECEEWEGIFCEESLKSLSSSSNVCFPQLKEIQIQKSNKVRRVFSYSLASHCPSLEKIVIIDCSQLEGLVLPYEGEQEVADHHQGLFPKLNQLELANLPKLREIYRGHEFNHLSGFIHDCPNICNNPCHHNIIQTSSSELEINLAT